MSDNLSRHPVTTTEKPSQSRIAEEYVICRSGCSQSNANAGNCSRDVKGQ